MRLAAGFALALTLSLSTPAFADLIDPDAGATNNSTNSATNNTTAPSNNATTQASNNGTGGPTVGDTTPTEPTSEENEKGCSVASSGSAPFAPLLVGVVLLGASRRRRRA